MIPTLKYTKYAKYAEPIKLSEELNNKLSELTLTACLTQSSTVPDKEELPLTFEVFQKMQLRLLETLTGFKWVATEVAKRGDIFIIDESEFNVKTGIIHPDDIPAALSALRNKLPS